MIRVGTAGWSLPGKWRERFPEGESHRFSVKASREVVRRGAG